MVKIRLVVEDEKMPSETYISMNCLMCQIKQQGCGRRMMRRWNKLLSKRKKAFLVYVFHDSDVVIASLTRLRFLVLKFWSYSSGSREKRLTGIQSYAGS
jgi:hypothetical protein